MLILWFAYAILPILANKPPKLNVGKLLLPHNLGLPSEYVLEVINGDCYSWWSSNRDIVAVRPLYTKEDCVFKAIVSVISSKMIRQSATVVAEDTINGQRLNCEVIVDCISSIDILSITRKLYLESDPLAFQVQAKNCENDTFSTVNGLEFEWNMISSESKFSKDNTIFVPYINSKFTPPRLVDFWEKQRLRGYSILVKGVQRGTTRLTVRPKHRSYEEVKPAEITLTVFSNVFLHHWDKLYLLPGTEFKFRLVEVKYGDIHKELLSCDKFLLRISDSSSMKLNADSLVVTAVDYGEATVFLIERDNSEEGQFQQAVNIQVVGPVSMKVIVFPQERALQKFSQYIVTVKIFDDSNNNIYLPENVIVNVEFSKDYFEIVNSACNGTYHVVKALKAGSCVIKADLVGIGTGGDNMISFEPSVCTTLEVIILERLMIVPSYTLLPWDSQSEPKHSIDLCATGGNGDYKWQVSDPSVAELSIDCGPNVTVVAINKGDTDITVSDGYTNYSVHAKISIRSVGEIKILPSTVEAEVSGTVTIPLGIYGNNDELQPDNTALFSDCSKVNLEVEISKNIVTQTGEWYNAKYGGCRCLQFTCIAVGFSWITIKYKKRNVVSETKTLIACYTPLKLLYPPEVVLAIGSSIDIIFQGGPRPWILHPEGYHINVTEFNGTVLSLKKLNDLEYTGRDLHVYRALCIFAGETSLNLTVGNLPSETNPYPVIKSAYTTVICSSPAIIHLCVRPNKAIKENLCPITEATPKIPFPVSKNIEIGVLVKDSLGRIIRNISSLCIEWKIVDFNLAKVKFPHTAVIEVDGRSGYRKIVGAFQIIQPRGKSGHVYVTADIIGYRKEILNANNIKSVIGKSDDRPIKMTVEFELVENVEIVPPVLTVFNHPLNKGRFAVNKGSGYFSLVADNTDKATIRYDQNKRQIEVLPLKDGFFRIYLVDLCLDSEHITTAEVRISSISKVLVQMPDKMEVGRYILANVQVLDGEGNSLPLSNSFPIKLHPKTNFDIISVHLEPSQTPERRQSIYKIKGITAGKTDLIFVAEVIGDERPNKTSLSSEPLTVQVYSPLSVQPSHITLVPGSSYQVTASGGPRLDSRIHYSITNEDIAEISKTGVVTGKIVGCTDLHITFFDLDESMENLSPLMQSRVYVNVSPFVGIKIRSPARKIQKGTELILVLLGEDENGNLHVINDQIINVLILWSVNNPEVVSLEQSYRDTCDDNQNNFATKIKALRPGFATINVTVEIMKDSPEECMFRNPLLRDEILIRVFEKLILTHPEREAISLLMTPNTELSLRTNRDGVALVQFVLSSAKETLATISDNKLISGHHCGDTVLIVIAEEEFGIVQKLAIHVEIKKISFITVTPVTPSDMEELLSFTIPVGLSRTFLISYHDSIGQAFHSINSKMQCSPSRHDLIRASYSPHNNTLTIEAFGHGVTVLKLQNEQNLNMINYMLIRTEAAIQPSNLHLTVGDVVCFSFALKSLYGDAKWSSSEKCVSIHPISGVAVAQEPGNSLVIYGAAGKFSTKTSVQVKPATSIKINRGSLEHISNAIEDGPYKIQVSMWYDNEVREKIWNCDNLDKSCLVGFTPPFRCSVQFENSEQNVCADEIFTAEAAFDWDTGNHYCNITSKGEFREVSDLIADIYIKAYLVSSEAYCNDLIIPSDVKMRFIPSFYLNRREIVVSETYSTATVTVIGVPQVLETLSVIPSDPEIIGVSCAKQDYNKTKSAKYTIRILKFAKLSKTKNSDLNVKFASRIIKQCEEVAIIVDNEVPLYTSSRRLCTLLNLMKEDNCCLGSVMFLLLGVAVIALALHTYKGITGRTRRSEDQRVIARPARPAQPHQIPTRQRSQLWTVQSRNVPTTRNVATSTFYPPNSSLFPDNRRNFR